MSCGRDVRQLLFECGALASLRSKYFIHSGSVSGIVSHIGVACSLQWLHGEKFDYQHRLGFKQSAKYIGDLLQSLQNHKHCSALRCVTD